MNHGIFFLTLFFALSINGMEQTVSGTQLLPEDIITHIKSYLDLASISVFLRTCSAHCNQYRKISREGLLHWAEQYDHVTKDDLFARQFGMDRFLQQNPLICKSLNADDHLTTLVHYAQTNNEIMFRHIITNENSLNRTHRISLLEHLYYLKKKRTETILSDIWDIPNSMKAYKAICKDDANMVDRNIHIAIQRNIPYVVKLFIKNKVNLFVKTVGGSSVLHTAIDTKNEQLVQLLIANGAFKTGNHLWYASKLGCIEIVQLLIQDVAICIHNSNAIHIAALEGHTTIVQLFLDNGIRVNTRDSGGNTPLHQAVCGGHTDIAKMLINNNADTTLRNYANETAFNIANRLNCFEIKQFLIPEVKPFLVKDEYCIVS